LYKKNVRTYRLSNFQDGMLIRDCIDSTAYSFFTNPVYVSRTSNQLGTISLFSRDFVGKPRKVTRKQTRPK